MMIEPFFITGLIIVFTCLLLIILAVIVLYFRASRAFSSLNTEFVLYKREQETQARAALVAATKKADEIITSTQLFSDETKKSVMDAINRSLANGQNTYSQIIQDLGNKSIADIVTFSDGLKKAMTSEASSMTQSFQSELQKEQHMFELSLSQNESKILKEVQERANKMLPDILKEAASISISPQESEEYVLTALETIKKHHGFS